MDAEGDLAAGGGARSGQRPTPARLVSSTLGELATAGGFISRAVVRVHLHHGVQVGARPPLGRTCTGRSRRRASVRRPVQGHVEDGRALIGEPGARVAGEARDDLVSLASRDWRWPRTTARAAMRQRHRRGSSGAGSGWRVAIRRRGEAELRARLTRTPGRAAGPTGPRHWLWAELAADDRHASTNRGMFEPLDGRRAPPDPAADEYREQGETPPRRPAPVTTRSRGSTAPVSWLARWADRRRLRGGGRRRLHRGGDRLGHAAAVLGAVLIDGVARVGRGVPQQLGASDRPLCRPPVGRVAHVPGRGRDRRRPRPGRAGHRRVDRRRWAQPGRSSRSNDWRRRPGALDRLGEFLTNARSRRRGRCAGLGRARRGGGAVEIPLSGGGGALCEADAAPGTLVLTQQADPLFGWSGLITGRPRCAADR